MPTIVEPGKEVKVEVEATGDPSLYNHIPNPRFEVDTSRWTVVNGTQQRVTTEKLLGAASNKLTPLSPYMALVSDPMSLTERDHTVSAHIKGPTNATVALENGEPWGYGGTGAAKNASSPALIDLEALNAPRILWLPGTAGNYVSTPDRNELDYDRSTFENTASGWSAADPAMGSVSRKTTVDWPSPNLMSYNIATMESSPLALWQGIAGVTLSASSAWAKSGTTSLLATATAGQAGKARMNQASQVLPSPLAPRSVFAASIMLRHVGAAGANGRLSVEWWNGGSFLASTAGSNVAFPTGAETTLTVVGVVPSNATRFNFVVGYDNNATSGDVFYLDNAALFDVTPTWTVGGMGGNLLSADASSFETSTGGWTQSSNVGGTLVRDTTDARDGTASLLLGVTAAFGAAALGLVGLTVGGTYTVLSDVRRQGGSNESPRQEISGVAGTQTLGIGNEEWQSLRTTFIASATSHSLLVRANGAAAGTVRIDKVGLYQLAVPAWVPPTGGSTNAHALNSQASLATPGGAKTTMTGLTPSVSYATSAYVFPPADGVYSVSMPSAPTPTTESGPGRRYARAKNGAGVLVEEATVNLWPGNVTAINSGGNISGWNVAGNGTISADASRTLFGSASVKRSGLTALNDGLESAGAFAFQTAPSTVYTVSAYAYSSVATTFQWWNNTGGDFGSTTTVPAGVWTRITGSFTSSTSGGSYIFRLRQKTDAATDVWFSGFQVEKKSYATTFTDGSLGTGYSYASTTNLVANPSFETDTAGWEGLNKNLLTANQSSFETDTSGWIANANATLARTTAQAVSGTGALAMTATATGANVSARIDTPVAPKVIPGQVYTAIASFRAATTSRVVSVGIDYRNAAGQSVAYYGRVATTNSLGWTQAVAVAQAPATADHARILVVADNPTAGEVHYVDAVSLMHTPNANLMVNGDFESGFSGWWRVNDNNVHTASTEQAYTGRQSLKVHTTTTDVGYAQIDLAAPAATLTGTATLSAYIYSTVARNYSIADSVGNIVATVAVPANAWTRISHTGTGMARYWYIRTTAAVAANTPFYIDAVQLVVGSTAPTYVPPTTVNLLTNPSFEVDTTGWDAQGANQAVARSTVRSYVGSASLLWTATAVTGGDPGATWQNFPTVVGQRYTLSAYVWQDSLVGTGLRALVYSPGLGVQSGTLTTVVGAWARVSYTFTATDSATSIYVTVGGSPAVNSQFYVDAVQLEYGSVATPYVDGSLGAGYSWDSSGNIVLGDNSTFETSLGSWNSAGNANVSAVRDTVEFWQGAASLRIDSLGSGNAWYSTGTNTVPVVAGGTYTFSAYTKADVARLTSISINWYGSGGYLSQTSGGSVTATTSWTRRAMTVVAPVGAVSAQLSTGWGAAAAGEKVWLDGVQFEQRDYVTPFNSAGTAHASTSTRRSPWVLGGTSLENFFQDTGGQHGTKRLRMSEAPWHPEPVYGVQTTVAVTAGQTYTYSATTQTTAAVHRAVSATTGTVLATSAAAGTSSSTRHVITFTVPAGTTSVHLQVLPYLVAPNLLLLDAVQLEQRDYVTPFGVDTHGGVAGYPSIRAKGELTFAVSSVAMNNVTSAVTFKYLPNGAATNTYITHLGSTITNRLLVYVGSNGKLSFGHTASSVGNVVVTAQTVFPDDIVAAVLTYDGTTAAINWSVNGGTVQRTTTPWSSTPTAATAIHVLTPATGASSDVNGIVENVIVLSSALTQTDAATMVNALSGTSGLPSTFGNRSDCVFSAFVNDPAPDRALVAGQWQRMSKTQPNGKGTQSDLVILGPEVGSTPYYVDSVQVEKGTGASPYTFPNRITGDIDLRAHVALEDWTPATLTYLVAAYNTSGGNRRFALAVTASTGVITLLVSQDGAVPTAGGTITSSVAPSVADGQPLHVRATRNATTGEVLFYTSPDGITWTQLGSSRTSTPGPIFNGPASIEVGTVSASNGMLKGKVLSTEVRAGINGTVVARYDATQHVDTTYTDTTGKIWSVSRSGDATAEIVDRNTWAFTGPERLMFPDRNDLDFGAGEAFTVASGFGTRNATVRKVLLAKAGNTGAGPRYDLAVINSQVRFLVVPTTAETPRAELNSVPSLPSVYGVAAGSREGTSLKTYLNSTVSATTTSVSASGDLRSSYPLSIGGFGAAESMSGFISWTAIFRRALTSVEHAELAAWDGKVATEPAWLRNAAALYINADDKTQRATYAASNSVINLAQFASIKAALGAGWNRLIATGPAGTNSRLVITVDSVAHVDGVMVHSGDPEEPYADGSFGYPWFWTGTPENSVSFRPSQQLASRATRGVEAYLGETVLIIRSELSPVIQ